MLLRSGVPVFPTPRVCAKASVPGVDCRHTRVVGGWLVASGNTGRRGQAVASAFIRERALPSRVRGPRLLAPLRLLRRSAAATPWGLFPRRQHGGVVLSDRLFCRHAQRPGMGFRGPLQILQISIETLLRGHDQALDRCQGRQMRVGMLRPRSHQAGSRPSRSLSSWPVGRPRTRGPQAHVLPIARLPQRCPALPQHAL
jgi:hypothetical protein